jgi:hypothetical protein
VSIGLPGRDDRNRRFSMCRPCDLPPAAPDTVRVHVRRMERARWCGIIANILLVFAGVNLVLLYANQGTTRTPNTPPTVFLVSSVILTAGVLLLVRVRAAGFPLREAVQACVEALICPACGYPLGSAKVEGDGCRVCPECGGAWRG